ncbi:MAG: hypothetical protein QXQ63_02925, partial [Candidatus Bathyarchaeia archaeon]
MGFAAGTFLPMFFHLLFDVKLLLVLVFFNILYVLTTFPLDGSLIRKTALLLIGNFIGFTWNIIIHLFALSAAEQFGVFFGTIYLIISPFLNLIWIVSFWSLS